MTWRILFVSLSQKVMIRYTIKLSKQEVEELEAIVNKGSHKSQTYRAAYILLSLVLMIFYVVVYPLYVRRRVEAEAANDPDRLA